MEPEPSDPELFGQVLSGTFVPDTDSRPDPTFFDKKSFIFLPKFIPQGTNLLLISVYRYLFPKKIYKNV